MYQIPETIRNGRPADDTILAELELSDVDLAQSPSASTIASPLTNILSDFVPASEVKVLSAFSPNLPSRRTNSRPLPEPGSDEPLVFSRTLQISSNSQRSLSILRPGQYDSPPSGRFTARFP
jgi:hypothetical protein